MIEINLIPDVKRELLRAQAQRNVVISIATIFAIGAAAVVIIASLYVFGGQALMMKTANDEIDKQYKTLSESQDLDKMLTIQSQLSEVSSLNDKKNITSRLYGMLNVVVPGDPHSFTISSVQVGSTSDGEQVSNEGALVTIEGQTVGSYASLEVFEKTIAAAVIEYKPVEEGQNGGDINCGNSQLQCRYLVVGGGDRAQAVTLSELGFGENENGAKTLRFKLSFTVVPEFLSNAVKDLVVKIGTNGNVTDSYLGVPRNIFGERAKDEGADK